MVPGSGQGTAQTNPGLSGSQSPPAPPSLLGLAYYIETLQNFHYL